MRLGAFLKKAAFFLPLIGGWYASKNPSSRKAIEVASLIITTQLGRGATRGQMLDMLDQRFKDYGFSAELCELARAWAEKEMDRRGLK